MPTASTPSWAILPLVLNEVYTECEEHLEYLYQAALKAITRRSMSTVMLGQRRMGKTEIFICINEILAVDLSSGFIWGELNDQVSRWIERLNEYGITNQNKSLPGLFLHASEDIPVNWHFSYIRHRVRLGAAKDLEVDVYAAAGSEFWLCESKWWRQNRRVGATEVRILHKKGQIVREDLGDGLEILRLWFFAYSGFTDEAESLMQAEGVLWSDRQDLDGLLAHVGLRRLPEI